jgi:hypothetical protein
MKKNVGISILFGFVLGYLTFIGLDEFLDVQQVNTDSHMNHGDMHMHEMIEVQSENAPSLSLNVYPDDISGYNIQFITENYTFMPELVNTENIQNEGHGHIYINDQKVARIYGEWFHLDNHHLTDEENILRATLNAHDHSQWSINNNPIEVVMTLN